MQILSINNRNFLKPSRNPSNKTREKILENKFLGQLVKKIWFRVSSVTAEMLEHQNSGENRRRRSEIFFENLRRAYKDWIQATAILEQFHIQDVVSEYAKSILTYSKNALNEYKRSRRKLHQYFVVNGDNADQHKIEPISTNLRPKQKKIRS